jgi:hypothetical protein
VSVSGLGISLLTGIVRCCDATANNTILHFGTFHLPTATFFDLGVMLIVLGTLMTIFVELAKERR